MTFASMARAARSRVRVVHDGTEAGFVMIYVLMITTIVTVLVGATSVVAATSVIPAVRSGLNQAAYAAAQGGLASFVSYADRNCVDAHSAVATCTLPTNTLFDVPIYSQSGTNGYSASYTWQADKDSLGRYFRVRASGTVTQGGLSVKKTLVADVAGGASNNLLDYGVVTGFETQSPDLVFANFPRRTIAIDSSAVAAAGVPVKGGKITWSGASPGVAAGKLAVCNSTYSGQNGRSTNLPPGAPNHYVDWSEDGLQGNNYTNYQPCQTSFGHLTKLLAPINPADGVGGYFSKDALLLSNSFPGGTGPLFDQPVTTLYQYTPADGPCGTIGQNYRPFNLLCDGFPVDVGGSPAPTSKYGIQYGTGPNLPTNNPEISATACVYNGPTRVKLNTDGTATVSSPQTTQTWVNANAATRPAQCYAGANGVGMSAAPISLTTPSTIRMIYVQNDGDPPPTTPAQAHGSSGWNTTGQKLGDTASSVNSVFSMTSGTPSNSTIAYTATSADAPYSPATGDNPSTKADGGWTPQWTSFSTGTNCDTSTTLTDLKFFDCYLNSGGTPAGTYPAFKATVQAALAANPGSYTTAAALQTYLQGLLSAGNSSDGASAAPSIPDNRSHRWKVAVASAASATDGCSPATGTPATTNTAVGAPSTDPFFVNTDGSSAVTVKTDTTCFTATVTLQVGTCNVALVLGVCVNVGNYVWGNSVPLGGGQSIAQFKSTFTVRKTTTGAVNVAGTSSFPSMADVTQYQMGENGTFDDSGPGDLYVEGTAPNSLALIAQNDVVVTGSLSPTDTVNQALLAIALGDFRIYHPVKCLVTLATAIAATDPGFCPNDITGLYNRVLADGARPDQQYTNLRPDLHDLSIHGALFALGIPQSTVTCPQPPQGGGVCGGEFTADNYSRGDSVGTDPLGTLLIVGTIAMAHHGAVGEEWEIPDAVGQTSRPYSGYQLSVQYQNLKNAVITLNQQSGVTGLQTTSTTSSLWHVVSVSTGRDS
jgi:hypothetical protein